MKLFGEIENAVILTRKTEKNAKTGNTYFRVGLMFPDTNELGEIGCNEDIYNKVESVVGDFKHRVNLSFVYNTDFKNISIYDVTSSK